MRQKAELISRLSENIKLTALEQKTRISIKELPLKPIKCTSCGRFIDYTEPGNVVFVCPVCKQGIIVRCSKCRKIGRPVKCPVCGTEFP